MKRETLMIYVIAFFIGMTLRGTVYAMDDGVFFDSSPILCENLPKILKMSRSDYQKLAESWRDSVQVMSLKKEEREYLERFLKNLIPKRYLPEFLLDLDIEKTRFFKLSSGDLKCSIPFKKLPGWLSTYPHIHISFSDQRKTEYIVPTHAMDDFMRNKQNCFFVPVAGDETLSAGEREFVQTLDNCLNKIFAFLYARPCSNMDKKILESGVYSGLVHEIFLLTRINRSREEQTSEERRKNKKRLFSLWDLFGPNGLQYELAPYRSFSEFKENKNYGEYQKILARYSNEENMVFMYLGFPLTLRDGFEAGAETFPSRWESMCKRGQENVMENTFGQDIFTVETTGNIKGEKAMLHFVRGKMTYLPYVDQLRKIYEARFNTAIYCTALLNDEAIRMLIMDYGNFDPMRKDDSLNPFQKQLLKRYETVLSYDRKLKAYALRGKPAPKSLSHTKLLYRELQKNYAQLLARAKIGGIPPTQPSRQLQE